MGFLADLTGKTAANAAKKAASIQAGIAKENKALGESYTNASLGEFDTALDQALAQLTQGENAATSGITGAIDQLDPYAAAGKKSLSQITALLGLDGADAAEAARAGFIATPGYDFRVGQGVQALDRSASARGGLYSGAAGKALTEYGQEMGSNEWGNYMASLSGLAGSGQTAAGGISSLLAQQGATSGQFAGARADTLLGTAANKANTRVGGLSAITGANTQIGQANAGGILGAANARAAGAGNILNLGVSLGKLALGMPG